MAFILESRNRIFNACSDPTGISCALNDRLEETRLFPSCCPFTFLYGQTFTGNRATYIPAKVCLSVYLLYMISSSVISELLQLELQQIWLWAAGGRGSVAGLFVEALAALVEVQYDILTSRLAIIVPHKAS